MSKLLALSLVATAGVSTFAMGQAQTLAEQHTAKAADRAVEVIALLYACQPVMQTGLWRMYRLNLTLSMARFVGPDKAKLQIEHGLNTFKAQGQKRFDGPDPTGAYLDTCNQDIDERLELLDLEVARVAVAVKP